LFVYFLISTVGFQDFENQKKKVSGIFSIFEKISNKIK